MTSSHPFEIAVNQTQVFFTKKHRETYEFFVTDFAYLPLRIKKRRMLSDEWVLTFDYICTEFISHISVFVKNQFIVCRNVSISESWTTFSVDLTDYKDQIEYSIWAYHDDALRIMIAPTGASEAVFFKIRNIRLRSRTADESEKAAIRAAYRDRRLAGTIDTLSYLYDDIFQNQIDLIEADAKEIRVEGVIGDATPGPVYLCELPIFKDFTTDHLDIAEEIKSDNGRFSVTIPRTTEQYGSEYDRIYSRWVLACCCEKQLYICSHARYADKTRMGHIFPPLRPETKKGLGDYTYNPLFTDLKDLGISYITFNIRINDFLRLESGKNNDPFEYNGKTYYVDMREIEKYDRTIRHAAEHHIDVSAILLVYPELWSRDSQVGRMLEHPEYERGGAYSMPNMTNIGSLSLYAAAIDFLAARYNRPDGKYGRIHRWIVHNEVNSGRVWTNAGNKTAVEFMDIYVKSMRLIYYTARKYDADAEVLISLDHFWNDANKEPNCYPAVRLLQILMDYCKVEGDFKWGVAFHPYPESLLNPQSWHDPNALPFPDSPLITFKNLEVLDEWIKKNATFYHGKKRTLLLSEQNPNALDYTEDALQRQAAGLAYAWKKMQACHGIDAYIAHSWIDARFEGGLKTGLRKYPDDPTDPCGIKPSWFVFRDAGTQQESTTFEFAKKIIGIQSWEEIIAPVQYENEMH
ncbi:DUF5722 domain-containing protein [Alistipes ihumii]|jgi:hypothetical protein|uniref:DUF5722 domain-containing protein n=1 Tax=Alistipes ihumii TaxID=1470347 RepID=UPI002495203E|nr:DUF5722 domain-containing protein [Alistipes ihumii]